MNQLFEVDLLRKKIINYVDDLERLVLLLELKIINHFMVSLRIAGKVIQRGKDWHSSLDCNSIILCHQRNISIEHENLLLVDVSWN